MNIFSLLELVKIILEKTSTTSIMVAARQAHGFLHGLGN